MRHSSANSSERLFPFIIVGNKCDDTRRRTVTRAEAQRWCHQNKKLPYIETSARLNYDVHNAFREAARRRIEESTEVVLKSQAHLPLFELVWEGYNNNCRDE
uniref:Uncharacterized protein n=1 Tax=Lotharella oceanica TaxID=641309 RepID=A0A7S2TQK1_9EUKA|mmetsp:Transcript_25477/g.47534  ORF Transcript_25477/g.47534 Transcript_25477/m.47534 type:complete len:102 (+) Transcript_25477:318-623(+)